MEQTTKKLSQQCYSGNHKTCTYHCLSTLQEVVKSCTCTCHVKDTDPTITVDKNKRDKTNTSTY